MHWSAYSQKVGLVLSGGGPRGVAHVGVLKALEENNVPVDYIIGTSMGAIVGGLYAAGYSPDEILELISSEELSTWLSEFNSEFNNYFFKLPAPNAAWKILKITYDSIVMARLPTNLIAPHELDFGFMRLFSEASAAAGYNFDSLYIPFRCVAADIVESRPIVLRNGKLEKAVRASMTFPFYFKPIKINNRILFDGGMYNNFPVDILEQEFNPGVIIGSKAATNYPEPEEDDFISLVQSMLMANTNYELDSARGILIEPNLWSTNLTDFSNTRAFVDSGYVAAKRMISLIREQVSREEYSWEKQKKREAFKARIPAMKFASIDFSGINEKQDIYLHKSIRRKILNLLNEEGLTKREKFDLLKKEHNKLLADKAIDNVYTEVRYKPENFGYDVTYKINRANKLEFELGGLVSSRATNEIFGQIDYNLWGRNSLNLIGNVYLGRFHNSGFLGARLDVPLSVPMAFELSYTLNGWNYFKTNTYFFEDDIPSFLVQQDSYWALDVSSPLSTQGKITASLQTGRKKDEYYQTNQFSRLDTADVTYFDFYTPAAFIEFSTLNRKQFPSHGQFLKVCGRFIAGEEKNIPGSTSDNQEEYSKYHTWFQIRLKFLNHLKLWRKTTFGFYGEAAFSTQDVFNNYTASVLIAPAFEPLPESQTIFLPQFRAYNFLAGGVKFIFPVYRNFDFRLDGYLFQPVNSILRSENNTAELGPAFSNPNFIASTRFVYHAPFGPISVGGDYYDGAEDPFLFNISIGYYIFNKRPFN